MEYKYLVKIYISIFVNVGIGVSVHHVWEHAYPLWDDLRHPFFSFSEKLETISPSPWAHRWPLMLQKEANTCSTVILGLPWNKVLDQVMWTKEYAFLMEEYMRLPSEKIVQWSSKWWQVKPVTVYSILWPVWEKNLKNEWICVYVYLIHFAVHLKRTTALYINYTPIKIENNTTTNNKNKPVMGFSDFIVEPPKYERKKLYISIGLRPEKAEVTSIRKGQKP